MFFSAKQLGTVVVGCMVAVSASPALGGSLLGIVGDKDSGSLVTLGSGSAGDSGTVNVGLGGGGGNVADVNVGGSDGGTSLVHANVNTNGNTGLSGGDSVVDVHVGLGLGGGSGHNGDNGNNGNDGKNGANGQNGVNGQNGHSGRDGRDGVVNHYYHGYSSRLDDLIRLIKAEEWQKLAKRCNISVEVVKAQYWLDRGEQKMLPSVISQNARYIGTMQDELMSDPSYRCLMAQVGVGADRIIAIDYQRNGKVLLLVV